MYIRKFFETYPQLKNKISFIGNIEDKAKLNDLYVRARIFILTSRYESFGIVSMEAASYGDYLILTDVGAAQDLIPDNNFGYILPESKQDNQNEVLIKERITETINAIIHGTVKTDIDLQNRRKYVQQFSMANIVCMECFRDWLDV